MSQRSRSWAAPGDVNAFFGLMLDNVAGLILLTTLLSATSGISTSFILQHMVPGTAIGVLVGDLIFFWLCVRQGRRQGRADLTAMPLGLDTPSTYGMILFVLGPAFASMQQKLAADGVFDATDQAAAERFAWHIGIGSIFLSGIFKGLCAFGSGWIRRHLPRAGLLGSLASIALVLISFLPLIETLHSPIVGFLALAIVLTTLVARVPLPGKLPGALGAVLVAGTLHYAMAASDRWAGTHLLEPVSLGIDPQQALLPIGWLEAFGFEWTANLTDVLKYLPIVIPFALATVVGGIDCTESAAAAGDEYSTVQVISVEALATLLAALCGGVIQTTPYIGHPAYKAMGGRAGYTLATALVVGILGITGAFAYLYVVLPKPIVLPILVFIGIEITSQSFHATPRRHYPAVALSCVPALATLAAMYVGKLLSDPSMFAAGIRESSLTPALQGELLTIKMLASGFILTSLLWASALAMLIDRRWIVAAAIFATCALATAFGIMHSPLPDGSMFLPWQLADDTSQRKVLEYVGGYAAATLWSLALYRFAPSSSNHSDTTTNNNNNNNNN